MKQTLIKIKDGIFVGVGILLVLGITNAWTGLQASTGDTLDATNWNSLVTTAESNSGKLNGISNVGGNIGIGSTNPISKLTILKPIIGKDFSSSESNIYIRGSDMGYGLALGMHTLPELGAFLQSKLNDVSSPDLPLLINPEGGNVGIGAVSPNSTLTVGDLYDGVYDYIRIDSEAIGGTPPAGDCSTQWHRGRLFYDATTTKLYICSGTVWKYIVTN